MMKRLLHIVVAVTMCALPLEAYAICNATGDVLFTVSNDTSVKKCVYCIGPFGRHPDEFFIIDAGEQGCTWYSANRTGWSPFGKWTCEVHELNQEPDVCDFTPFFTTFCVQDIPGNPGVHLTIQADNSLTVNFPPPPCTSSVRSTLGDDSDQTESSLDTDTFFFTGTAGDQVTLRLEADPQAGHNGGTASLGLRDAGSVALNRATSGTPPLELTATLPATGQYSVEVGQPEVPDRFRGAYTLRITTTTGSLDRIEPAVNVEK